MEPIELEVIMRNSTKGGIKEIVTDVSGLQTAFEKTGAAIQSRIDLLNSSIKGLGEELDALRTKFENALDVGDYVEQIAQISVLREEIDALAISLTAIEQQHQEVVNNTNGAMPDATAGAEKQSASALFTGTFDEAVEGVEQLNNALSDGVNVVALFTGENEKLERVQRALQAVTVITNGLKSASILLDKESAFQTVIVANAKNLLTAATNRLAIAFGISTVAAQAMMATLTLGLSVAITAIIALCAKFSSAQDEVKRKQEEAAESAVKQKEADEALQKSAAATVATQLVEYKKLQEQYKALGDDLQAKKKFVDENQEAFRKLGVSVGSVSEAENLLVDNEGAFIASLQRKALAAAAMELASDKYKKALEKMVEAENLQPTDQDRADAKIVGQNWENKYRVKHKWTVGTAPDENYVKQERNAHEEMQLNNLVAFNKQGIQNEAKDFLDKGNQDILASVKLLSESSSILKANGMTPASTNGKKKDQLSEKEKDDLKTSIDTAAVKAQKQLEDLKYEAMAEGLEKRLELLNREQTAKNASIEEERKKRLEDLAIAKKNGVQTDVSEDSINNDAGNAKTETKKNYAVKIAATKEADKKQKDEAAQKEIQELQQKYQNLVDKRKEVKDSIQADIDKMETANKGGKEVYSQATIDEAKKQQTEALAEIDDKIQGTTSAMSQAFADMSGKTSKEMRAIANEAEAMYNAVKNGEYKKEPGDDAETQKKKNHGLTEEQFTTLKNDPEQMAKLGNQVKAVNSQADKAQNAFQKMGSGMKKVFSAGNDTEKLKEGISEIGEGFAAASAIGQQFSGTLSSIGELSGNEKFSEVGNTLSGAMDVANSAMSGAQAGAALGPMGAAAGAAMGLISSITEKFAGIKKANKELAEKMEKDQMNSYLSELEMNRVYRERYEWAQKIGESTVSHLKRGGTELKKQTTDNAAEQEELWAKLAGLEYESGSHVTKNFWGKKKEVKEYDSLAGKSWEEIERLANDNKLSDEGMKYFEALKSARQEGEDLAKRQEEWLESAKEFYTGTTVEGVANGIVEGFLQGKRSAADFSESFENMMRDSMTNALKDSMTEDVTKWRDEYYALANDEDGLTEKDIAHLREKYNAIIEKQSAEADELEKVTGIDLNANQQQQAGSGGGFTTMTQEQGTKLEGLFTSLQDHTISIDDKMTDISSVMYDSFNALTQIASNTNYCRHLETMASDIAEMKRDGIKMK